MRHSYPLLLDVTDRVIVIVGGGAVAARKARGLLDAGAGAVRCVAMGFSAEIPAAVQRIIDRYRPEHLEGAALVFAATDDRAVNNAVVSDARARGILVNRADPDEEEPGDFITPATWRSGAVAVTVSAGSAALAAALRDRIAAAVDPAWLKMADAMQSLRPLVKASAMDIAQRREVFRTLATAEAVRVLDEQGMDGLRRWLMERYPQLKGI